MSYTKSNAAYDFSRFAPAQEPELPVREKPEANPLPSKKAVRKHAKKQAVHPATVVKWVFVSLFVMTALGSIMVGNIRITQLSDEIVKTQKQLDTEHSVSVTLNAKLESRMSIAKVESYVTEKLGMVKIQPYQIQYVHLTGGDQVVVTDHKSGVAGFFSNLLAAVKEYFS